MCHLWNWCHRCTVKCFAWFIGGNLELNHQETFSRPVIVDDQIEILIKDNPGHMTKAIAEIVYIFHISVVRLGVI